MRFIWWHFYHRALRWPLLGLRYTSTPFLPLKKNDSCLDPRLAKIRRVGLSSTQNLGRQAAKPWLPLPLRKRSPEGWSWNAVWVWRGLDVTARYHFYTWLPMPRLSHLQIHIFFVRPAYSNSSILVEDKLVNAGYLNLFTVSNSDVQTSPLHITHNLAFI